MIFEPLYFFVVIFPFFGWHLKVDHNWLWKIDIVQLLVWILLQIRSLFVTSLVKLVT